MGKCYNTSYTLLKTGIELAVEATVGPEGRTFDITVSNGCCDGPNNFSVNVEMNLLTLENLETIRDRLTAVIEEYK